MLPNIHVLLATYNGEKYLTELLDSLLSQSYQDFAVLIHDDGSTDDTVSILKRYCSIHPEKFVLLEYPRAGSAKANFLSLLHRSTADYVAFCDQDDVWTNDHLEQLLDACSADGKSAISGSFGDLTVVNANRTVLAPSLWRYQATSPTLVGSAAELALVNCVTGCCFMFTGRVRDLITDIDIDKVVMHDHYIALVIVAHGGKLTPVNKSLVYYRQHAGNVLGAVEFRRGGLKKLFSLQKHINNIRLQVAQARMIGLEMSFYKVVAVKALKFLKGRVGI